MVLSQILRLQFLLFISIMSVMWQSSTWERLTHRREQGQSFPTVWLMRSNRDKVCPEHFSIWCLSLGSWNSTNSSYQSNNCALIVPQVIYSPHTVPNIMIYFLFFLWNTKQTFWKNNIFIIHLFIHWKNTIFLKVSGWKLFNFATFKYKIFKSS